MDIYSLEQILSQNLALNRARIKFLARFLIALFQVQTVNLTKIACVFSGGAKIACLLIRNCKDLSVFFDFSSGDGTFNAETAEDCAALHDSN